MGTEIVALQRKIMLFRACMAVPEIFRQSPGTDLYIKLVATIWLWLWFTSTDDPSKIHLGGNGVLLKQKIDFMFKTYTGSGYLLLQPKDYMLKDCRYADGCGEGPGSIGDPQQKP